MGHRVVEEQWFMMEADIMGPYIPSSQHKYIIIFQDFFTRWIEVSQLRGATGQSIDKSFNDTVTPKFLFTGNGTGFCNKLSNNFFWLSDEI